MVPVLATALLLSASPQGVSVQVKQLEPGEGATKDDIAVVVRACGDELAKQGYAVLKADDAAAKPMAVITGSLKKVKGDRWLVTLTLSRAADGQIIDETKLEHADLREAGTDGARRLATEIRATWGVRIKVGSGR